MQVQWRNWWCNQQAEAFCFAVLASQATQGPWFPSMTSSQRACLCMPCPAWKPGPVCEEGAHPGQVKGYPEGVVTDCMEVTGVRVHPAQGGAFLCHFTERWTEKGVSRKAALQNHGISPGVGGRSGILASDRFGNSRSPF